MTKFKLAGLVVLLLFFSAVANADILNPSSAIPGPSTSAETGTLVAMALASYTTFDSIDGKVLEGVYSETSATSTVCPVGQTCLDFVYQFTDTNPAVSVNTFSASDFDNAFQWTTNVYQTTSNAGALSIFAPPTATNGASTSATRSGQGPDQPTFPGGATVGFDLTSGGAMVGASNIFIIKTDAPVYVTGSVSLLGSDGDNPTSPVPPGNPPWSAAFPGTGLWNIATTETNPAMFAYNGVGYSNTFLAPIPEPGFYGVLAIGLAGLFLAVKHRRSKQSA